MFPVIYSEVCFHLLSFKLTGPCQITFTWRRPTVLKQIVRQALLLARVFFTVYVKMCTLKNLHAQPLPCGGVLVS